MSPESAGRPPRLRTLLRAGPGPVDLAAIDTRGTPGVPGNLSGAAAKQWARDRLAELASELTTRQEMLFAGARPAVGPPQHDRRLLLVLQAMDCGGKDGAVKRVARAMNPLGLRIVAFGPPTAEERSHDFLWRIRRALPAPGYVGVFNRSHYEDVLVVRVEALVPKDVWQARYEQINAFEREITDEGVTVVKVMLHISAQEQRGRLTERLADPAKHWKYNPGDLDARERWDDYQRAYADALSRCDTGHAPWFVVPADRKWYRDWAVAGLLAETLAGMDLSYPPAGFDVAAERRRLAAERTGSAG